MFSEHVISHYNAVPNTGIWERTHSKIYFLRNFNNWIKSMLIGEFLERLKEESCSSATVLDLCCGKGGDLLKWKIGNIKEIVMADVADVALNHSRDRYKELRHRFFREHRQPFDAHFIVADASEDDLMTNEAIANKNLLFDLCSCQFALHYSFQSEVKARRLLWNATRAIRRGGYFIATIPDATAILRYLRREGTGTFKNDVCKIVFEDFAPDGQPPLFGAKLNFELDEVVNCPEYLAYFPLIKKILNEYGMKLVYKLSFPEALTYYLNKDQRAAKTLMERMKVLERYPVPTNGSLSGQPAEYAHAAKRLEAMTASGGGDGPPGIGTLSKSEWEVVSMYLVFAFVKK